MHPVDHVVADVHRIGIRRQHPDLKRVTKTGCFESLIPPRSSLDQRVLYVFWSAAVDVINDRLYRLAHGRAWVFFLEAVTRDPAFFKLLIDIRPVIVKPGRINADTRVKFSRAIAIVRQLVKRMTFADCNVTAGRRDLANQIVSFSVCRKRNGRLDFGIFGKPFRVWQIQSTTALVKAVTALTCLIYAVADAVCIAYQKARRVNQDAVAIARLDFKTPNN